MKQVLQNPRTGKLELVEVPTPAVGAGQLLVRNHFSVVSAGTETVALSFARKSLLGKARSRPDLVRQVQRKLRQEGPLQTYRTVVNRLDAPQPLGYSSAGVVEAVGKAVGGFSPGDRVACAGAGYANHAEFVVVPANLAAPVPDGVSLESAAFSTLGAIALQGLRVAEPTLGEVAAVVGLGLIGQLAVQLLRSNGCRVLGIDLDETRVHEAMRLGAQWGLASHGDLEGWRREATEGYGADLALLTASAESAEPLAMAAELCRKKGRIAVVGSVPMELDRRVFYERELELRMSTSYGPGRYDRSYEETGLDYPLPYVRWTENRNLRAFLDLVSAGSVRPEALNSRIVAFDEATSVYEELAKRERSSLAVVFRYDAEPTASRSLVLETKPAPRPARERKGRVGIAFVGAGNYARSVLLPAALGVPSVDPVALVAASGPSARHAAERFGFARCGTEAELVLAPEVDLVFVATRHDSHAELAVMALQAGKAVWLEKPVGLRPDEVEQVVEVASATGGFLAIGYNRRFSSHVRAVREALAARREPMAIRYTVAPGAPPRDSWITDPTVGGGRIVGEVCHFVDLCTHLAGDVPTSIFARALSGDADTDDSVVALLGFPNGSTATIEYLAHANPELPKERFEVSAGGTTATCENFRRTEIRPGRRLRTANQDKGQSTAIREVVAALAAGRPSPFDVAEVAAVSDATFAIQESARTGLPVDLPRKSA